MNAGGGFAGSSSRDVSIRQYAKGDDKRESFIHNAIGQVRCGTSAHPEPACYQGARSCCLILVPVLNNLRFFVCWVRGLVLLNYAMFVQR